MIGHLQIDGTEDAELRCIDRETSDRTYTWVLLALSLDPIDHKHAPT